MDRKTMISNYIDNVYKELDEKKEQPAVPAGGGLAAKPVKPVVEEDDTEERQGIVSRIGNMLLSHFKSDDDDTIKAMTTSPVTLDNAAKQAALNDLSIVDIIKANRDTPKDSGLINIPRKAPKKPEVRINVQEILSRLVPPTLPDAPTPTPSAPGGEAPSDGKGLMSPSTDDDMGLPTGPSEIEELKDLYATKGKEYRKSKVKKYSYLNDPLVKGGTRGNSRIHGDASIETQNTVISRIIKKGVEERLSVRDIAIVLAIAKHESGFNPDAAAGTTSARGIGQFVNSTGSDYGINSGNQWDLDTQVDALIKHTKDNKRRAINNKKGEEYIYKYHHDGPKLDYGGLSISKNKVMPLVTKFESYLRRKGVSDPKPLAPKVSLRPKSRPEEEEIASN
tara:strand:+ start:135 stop:1313 length:1179 start_codon:yes stop_codon:yes gene_type:complete